MMKIGDKVLLKSDIKSIHMFPQKETIPEQKIVSAGSLGIINDLFRSGNGIVDFEGHKVLIMNLADKTEVI